MPRLPEALRRGPFREGFFPSRLHEPRTAVVLGRWLGLALTICFLTGLVSHALQNPPGWLAGHLPSRPADGYRVTQGLHVISGTAAIPLLAAKLWTVYPRLFEWPPVRGVLHALERLGIAALVGSVVLEVFTGLLNTFQWYPWPFPFRQTHFWLAWIAIGGLLTHLAAKAPLIAAHWRRPRPSLAERRGFLTAVTASVAVVTLTTAGQAVPWLRRLDLLAPRRPDIGAAAAGGQDSIGVRCPAHPVAHALLLACAARTPPVYGLAGPSANRFGRVSPTTAAHVASEFDDSLLVLDGDRFDTVRPFTPILIL